MMAQLNNYAFSLRKVTTILVNKKEKEKKNSINGLMSRKIGGIIT
jgi:hypothetical protein